MKKCKNCGVEKHLDEFHNNKALKDGKFNTCKVCVRARNEAWKQANPERYKAAIEAWWKAHPEKKKIKEDRRRARGYYVEYHKKNREKILARSKRHYEANKEMYEVKRLRWLELNAERSKAYRSQWKRENPDKIREYNHRRRAAVVAAGDTYTADEASAILEQQRHVCANDLCTADLRVVKKHLDHKIPLIRGGSNGKGNLQWLCAKCNLSKGALTDEEWRRKLGLPIAA